MAEGDAHVVNNFKEQLMLKTLDLVNDTFKIALFNKAYASTQIDGAAPAYGASPWDTDEIVASGYTAGGAAVATPAVSQVDASDLAKWDDDGSNVTWSNLATATILTALLYDDTVSDLALIIWEIATNSNGGNYTLAFNASGIMTLS